MPGIVFNDYDNEVLGDGCHFVEGLLVAEGL